MGDLSVLRTISTHINPNTGMTVPDRTILFLDSYIEEDANNYYAVRAWHTDGNDRKIYPKSEWIAEY